MPLETLRKHLAENGVKFVTISHSPAYTAQEIAASAHIPGREIAKTVIVKADDEMVMAVLPASFQIELERLKELVGAEKLRLATEEEFEGLFPLCEAGAMPPFGNLYGMRVFASESLAEDDEIAFNAGSHTELVRMKYADFARLVEPTVARFTTRPQPVGA